MILGEGNIIYIICKVAVYISVSELSEESKAINICKKLRYCTDHHKNLDKEKILFWVKEIGKLQDLIPSFLSSAFTFCNSLSR